jgi:hypothetical protein
MAEGDEAWWVKDYKNAEGAMQYNELVTFEAVQTEFERALDEYPGRDDKGKYGHASAKIAEAHYLILTLAGDSVKNLGTLKTATRAALFTHYILVLAKQLHTKTGRFGPNGDLATMEVDGLAFSVLPKALSGTVLRDAWPWPRTALAKGTSSSILVGNDLLVRHRDNLLHR